MVPEGNGIAYILPAGGATGCPAGGRTLWSTMCRSIKQLREGVVIATPEEIEAAALQFVRKISGFRQPSRRNVEAFDQAVGEVAAAATRLLEQVTAGRRG
jgi:hypothetical protein